MFITELFRRKKVLADSERSKDGVTVHITDTGRIWVDPNEVVKTDAFKKQSAAVKRLREAKEQAAQESAVA